MFILLSSEKNEPRSAAAVVGLCRSAAGTALGGCGTCCAQTILALILGWLASSRPDKGGGGTLRRIVPVIPRNDAESRNTVCHSRLDLESRKYSGVNTSKSFLSFWTPHRRAG